MGVKTPTARNNAAPTHHQDRATGRSRPIAVVAGVAGQDASGRAYRRDASPRQAAIRPAVVATWRVIEVW